jgi:16S rRNA (cytosine1402-N4)-methyltransferase
MYHITVLKEEICQYLVTKFDGVYIDVTAGGGGHSYALLEKYPHITLIACDWDFNAIKETEKRLAQFNDRVHIVHGSFSHIVENIKKTGYDFVDGIIADFGTSQHQLTHQEGFSFRYDSFLDMRMSVSHTKLLAVDILAHYSEKDLADIFYYYGQEKYSKKIARIIVEERKTRPIRTSLHLANLISDSIGKKGPMHPATKIFQALRIAVNKELEQIESFLYHVPSILNKGGRLACISFHSLEDGLVKQFYKNNKLNFEIVGPNKIILPSLQEIRLNPAARSAKLRVLEKLI